MKFTAAIMSATDYILENIPESFVIGLGVSYRNGADGTMGDLKSKYPTRILDTPVSEAAITGAALGSAITGMRPIVHHARLEFAMLAFDQIVTQASNWNYMFGGEYPAPITMRIAIGRQWGNGPQHTQAFYSLFGSIPGLKVVVPSSPGMAKQLLISAVLDPNPVIYLEPRWLYNTSGPVSENYTEIVLDKLRVVRPGNQVTLASFGDGVMTCLEAAVALERIGISTEVIDLVSLNPIDYENLIDSLQKTRVIVTLETSNSQFSVGREIIGAIHSDSRVNFNFQSKVIATPNVPCPTATSLTAEYYPTYKTVIEEISALFSKNIVVDQLSFEELHLSPQYEFKYE
jgi:pyruvate/2-oxoglutarate/acetoin dehydrogenase E1 component